MSKPPLGTDLLKVDDESVGQLLKLAEDRGEGDVLMVEYRLTV